MPLYSEDTATRSFMTVDEIPSTFSDAINAQYGQTLLENPSFATERMRQLHEAGTQGSVLTKADADQAIAAAGLTGHLTAEDGMTNNSLSMLIQRKNEELQRQQTMARARGGIGQGAARLGVALGTSLLDPVNVGLAFVPFVGEARYTRMLAGASGFLGRAGVRAGVGAIEGAAGAAVIEPLIYSAKQQEQADYHMSDSLMNVAFGTIFGGGLHTVGGAGADLYRSLRGGPSIDAPELAAEMLTDSAIPRAESLPTEARAIEARFAKQIEGDIDGAMAQYANLEGAEGGRLLNTDIARELSPEYRADRTQSSAVHEPASYLVKRMYEQKLAEAPGEGQDAKVLFSAGGTGAGKSTALDALSKVDDSVARAQIIYDTNMNTLDSALRRVDQALAAGKKVNIAYVWRDPVDALVNGALPRAQRMGRTVPLHEHAKTHVGAAKVVKQIAERYAGDERVSIQVIDNSHGKGKARLGSIDQVPDLEYNRVREDLDAALEEARRSGAISDAVYRGTKGDDAGRPGSRGMEPQSRAGDGRQPEPSDQVTAADRAAEASPQVREAALRTAVGQMADGRDVNVDPLFAGNNRDIAMASAREASAPDPSVPRQAEQAKAIDDEVAQSDTLLETAQEEAAIAQQRLNEQSKFHGLEPTDPAIEAAAELTKSAKRWSRAAELATACLMRGA